MMILGRVSVLAWLMMSTVAGAQTTFELPQHFDSPPPLSPEQALGSFRVQQGLVLQLVAAEPLVVDPVDVTYDESGRAYVVEMRGYPLPEKPDQPRPEPISRVKLLFDDDGDGQFDRATIFLDHLEWPTSVCLYRGGVFIADAPDLWYARDTDGDGVADIRRKVLTGFKRDNVQALMNGLRWGLDHAIYGAASGNGGVVSVPNRPEYAPVSVTRRDFRFDPETEKVDAVAGGARFGASFDDWGERFLCNIRNPVQHVVFPLEPLQRHPWLTIPSLLNDVAAAGETLPVFRISPIEAWREFRARRWVRDGVNFPRSELVGAGFFTSSSGVTIYRGDAYPAEMEGQAFVADVAANVVHRQQLTPDGMTFRGQRVDPDCELVASTDVWFRPVNFVNAPDGTLHIVDMYRLNIEHPWSIPDDIRARLDLTAGNDRGRIWRLAPADFRAPSPRKLGEMSTKALVALLASRKSWERDTAHRLLWERQDLAAVPLLRNLMREAQQPLGRLHALWSLQGLQSLQWDDLQQGVADLEPRVREHAVRLGQSVFGSHADWPATAMAMAVDDHFRVRVHAAIALGSLSGSKIEATLARLSLRDGGDAWMRLALLSAQPSLAPGVLGELLDRPEFPEETSGAELIRGYARIVGATEGVAYLREELVQRTLLPPWDLAFWSGWMHGFQEQAKSRPELLETLRTEPAWQKAVADAQKRASDEQATITTRIEAVGLLRWQPLADTNALFGDLLAPRVPVQVQAAVLQSLGHQSDLSAAELILARYRGLSPALKLEAVNLLAARPSWQGVLLKGLEEGLVPVNDIPVNRRALLRKQSDPVLLALADKYLGQSPSNARAEVVSLLMPALQLPADAGRGRVVFRRECAQCHQLRGEGDPLGPPLELVRHRSPEELLIHILDPNREVGPNYVDYVATLDDGRVLTGLLAEESETQLTLRRPQGARDVLARRDVDELGSTGKSLMPEGLEQRLTKQDLADVIDYLRADDSRRR